jgi:hypothetical protein
LAATQSEAVPEAAAGAGEQVKEIMPGPLEGYLTKEEQLDSKAFVLPAPSGESARQAMDTAWSQKMLKLRGSWSGGAACLARNDRRARNE